MSATVNKKDGLVLVREMAMEVKNMLDFKMNAVMVSVDINIYYEKKKKEIKVNFIEEELNIKCLVKIL